MPLTKKFLHKNQEILFSDKIRLRIGILLGLAYSFVFYSFLYMSREVFRIFSLANNYDLLILSESEISYYNLLYAFIAAIFGQSMAFQYILEKPRNWKGNEKGLNYRLLNDQRFFIWGFLSWFSRISLVFAIIMVLSLEGAIYEFSFFPKYNLLFILLLIVLFLQSWNGFNKVYKRKSYKWMFISLLSIMVVAFFLSKIHFVNYELINRIGLKNNIYHHYTLEVPESKLAEAIGRSHFMEDIYLPLLSAEETNQAPIIFKDEKMGYLSLYRKLLDLNSHAPKYSPQKTLRLHIDRRIKIKQLKLLKTTLSRAGISKIIYVSIPVERDFKDQYYRTWGIKDRIAPSNTPISPPIDYTQLLKSQSSYILNQERTNIFQLDGEFIEESLLKGELKKVIQKDPSYAIFYKIENDLCFSDYLKTKEIFGLALKELRNEFALKNYNQSFEECTYEQKDEILKLFPHRFIDLNNDFNPSAHIRACSSSKWSCKKDRHA